jgi:RNA polymerase sigma factor (sigma-70 family)
LVLDCLIYKRVGGGDLKDIELAKKAIAGNDDAFLELMFAHREALFKTALAYLKSEKEALEAIQEVTFRAYEKISKVRNPEYTKTWLIRIMMNYCRDVLKKQKRFVFDDESVLQQGISDNYTFLEIEDAMTLLSEEQRELIYMRYLNEIKIKDIAEMTEMPESTVKTRLYKTLGILKSYFEETGGIRRV